MWKDAVALRMSPRLKAEMALAVEHIGSIPMVSSGSSRAAALVPAGMVSFQVRLCSDWKWFSKSSE